MKKTAYGSWVRYESPEIRSSLTKHFEGPLTMPGERTAQLLAKLLKIMKLTCFFLFATLVSVHATGNAQNVTITGKVLSLKQVFQSVKKQTGYVTIYNKKEVNDSKTVSVAAVNMPLQQFLDRLLKEQSIDYSIEDKTIALFPRDRAAAPKKNLENPPTPFTEETVAKPITGIVKGRDGRPLVGASINIKGKKLGTVTDETGRFQIMAEEGQVLLISFTGYEEMQVTIKGNNELNIQLQTKEEELSGAVVTGLYKRPEQNFTGAATVLSKENLAKVTNGNLFSAISALDPSFQIPENITNGSNPNIIPDVQVRGGNSIVNPGAPATDVLGYANNRVNTPLFILDGFEVSMQRIFDLDINRVAKVVILKDAAATSIYGSRAANGVVIIELLTPQDGKLRLSVNSNITFEAPNLTDYDLLNAREKLDLEVRAGLYRSVLNETQERLNVLYAARLSEVERGVNTYWLSQPLRNSIGAKQNLYIEGGGNNALYGISLSYEKRNGVMKASDRENFQASTFLSYRIKDFQFRNELTLGFNKANNSPFGSFENYVYLNPYLRPYDENGNLKQLLENLTYTNGQLGGTTALSGITLNPLYNGNLAVTDQNRYRNVMNNTNLIWQAASWLRVNARLSIQQQLDNYDRFLPPTHTTFATLAASDFSRRGSYRQVSGQSGTIDGNLTADIRKSLGLHMLYGTTGLSFQKTANESTDITVTGFPNERLNRFFNAIQYMQNSKPQGSESQSRMAGYLTNLSYAYDNRYLMDFSYRLDGSSLFGAKRRFANFWSVGTGWNLHKEQWWNSNGNINQARFRYSFGYTGSQRFASYLAQTTARYYDTQYDQQYGLYLLAYGNENLAWQQTQKSNFGADFLLFNKLSVRGNYFVEKTQGALATVNTAPSTGFSSYQENLGDLINKGGELYLNYTVLSRKRDNINVFANFFSSRGEYVKLSNSLKALNNVADTSKSTRPLIRYAEGMSPTAIWAVKSRGIDPSNGREIYVTRNGEETNIYSTADQVIVGDSRPKVEGTFGSTLELNGIGFNVFFRFRLGGQVYNQTLSDRVENVDLSLNVDRRVYEGRWQKPGDHTFFKGITNPEGFLISREPTYPTSRFVQDYSFLSCENVSVYYRFTDKFNRRMRLSNTKISLYSGQLFRISNVKQERGLTYPFSQTFTILFQTTI